jgi:DNA replication protein DnaC
MGERDIGFYHRDLTPDPSFTITKAMLKNAGIGRAYWGCTIGKIPDTCAYKADLTEMVANLPADVKAGKGIIFYGNHGFGKTSASAIMLKSVMARGGQAFHRMAATVAHSYEKRWVETNLDGVQVWDMLTQSQLLTLDDLGHELAAAGYKAGDTRIVEELIRLRYDDLLPTYITTNLPVSELVKQYRPISSILLDTSRFYMIDVSGHNWRRGK